MVDVLLPVIAVGAVLLAWAFLTCNPRPAHRRPRSLRGTK